MRRGSLKALGSPPLGLQLFRGYGVRALKCNSFIRRGQFPETPRRFLKTSSGVLRNFLLLRLGLPVDPLSGRSSGWLG